MISRHLRALDPGLRLLLVTSLLAFICFVAAALVACEGAKATASEAFDMTCHPVTIDDRIGQRCENSEAICYVIDNNLSCIRK